MNYRRYSTGVYQLDELLHGGLSSGICEVIGEDSSGKSTLCLSVMREAHKKGLPTALVHTEGFPDTQYIRNAGPPECLVSVPSSAEASIESAYSSLLSGFKIVVIDTLSAAEPVCDRYQVVGDRTPFAHKKLAFHGLSVLREEALLRDALVIVVNQLRTPVKALVPKPCSSFEGTINKLCSTRLKTIREQTRTEYGKLAYIKVRFEVFRSLGSPPGDSAFGFLFNQLGFRREFELMRLLLSRNIFKKSGSYIVGPDGVSLGPGYMEAADQIKEDFEHYWRYYDGRSQSDHQ